MLRDIGPSRSMLLHWVRIGVRRGTVSGGVVDLVVDLHGGRFSLREKLCAQVRKLCLRMLQSLLSTVLHMQIKKAGGWPDLHRA